MNFLSLAYIKAHSRIDGDLDDTMLTIYGNAAEETVLSVMRRTLANVTDLYGSVPQAMLQAALMLTDLGYMQRSPISPTNMSVVPYTFDMLIAPYMRHDKGTELEAELDGLINIMTDAANGMTYSYEELDEPTDEQTATFDDLTAEYDTLIAKYDAIEAPTAAICAKIRTEVADYKERCENAFTEDETEADSE